MLHLRGKFKNEEYRKNFSFFQGIFGLLPNLTLPQLNRLRN
jgi:hypothetical protein